MSQTIPRVVEGVCPNGHVKPTVNKSGRCRVCNRIWHLEFAKKYPERVWLQWAWGRMKVRAREKCLPLVYHVIETPSRCPALGIPLIYLKGRGRQFADSPSCDRVVPELGYVPGNVRVISNKANSMKSDSTIEELESLLAWRKGLL